MALRGTAIETTERYEKVDEAKLTVLSLRPARAVAGRPA